MKKLPPDVKRLIKEFKKRNTHTFVSRLKPRFELEESGYWHVEHGPNMQSGVAGFGKTLEEALRDFETRAGALPPGDQRLSHPRG